MKISSYEIYFPSMNIVGGDIEQKDIEDIITKIAQDVDFQKQFIVDQDVVKNIPMPHKNFARTTSSKKCESCGFRKVCEELKQISE